MELTNELTRQTLERKIEVLKKELSVMVMSNQKSKADLLKNHMNMKLTQIQQRKEFVTTYDRLIKVKEGLIKNLESELNKLLKY